MARVGRGTTLIGGIAAMLLATAVIWSRSLPVVAAQTPRTIAPAAISSSVDANDVVKQYCVGCHNQRTKIANLTLDDVDFADVGAHAERLEKAVRKLRARSMPPDGSRRPDEPTYQALTTWLEASLDRAAAAKGDPGRTESLHRLNRMEYANAIRDVLGLEGIDVAYLLPPDEASYGFDNIAGVLGMSPTHLDRYLSAARKISRMAVGDPTLLPDVDKYEAPSDLTQKDGFEGLPFGSRGGVLLRRNVPVDAAYTLSFEAGTGKGATAKEPQFAEVSVDGERVSLMPLKAAVGPMTGGNLPPTRFTYEVSFPLRAGVHDIAVTCVKTSDAELERILQPLEKSDNIITSRDSQEETGPHLYTVSLAGPFNPSGVGDTPSRRRIFVCNPASASEERACARTIVTAVARRGYRRPPNASEVTTLLGRYDAERISGTFDSGIQRAIERFLASPAFLFRVEQDPPGLRPGTSYRVSDLELASRLSFFLWSSVPDDQLLDVAVKGQLKDPAVLERQVRRMMSDPKNTLVSSFFSQWLRLRGLPDMQMDINKFPEFDANLRRAMVRETELFVGRIVDEDRGVLDLLNADYTFVNERLARHYGMSNIYGDRFRLVTLQDTNRRGLLGKGSVLTVTSLPTRTSPVGRGKYLLDSFLGVPPPPPPANVPGLVEKGPQGKPRSMRDAMVVHRANPTCAACHKVMDPLGFALENFDATGAWRVQDADAPIDASGTLPDGTKFQGPSGLREALLARPEVFVSTFTEKLLTYALGRGVEYRDQPHLRAIVRSAAANKYRLSSLVLGIVKSVPFQMRRSAS